MKWKEIIDTSGAWTIQLLERIAADTGIRVGTLLALLVVVGLGLAAVKIWRR